MAERQTERILDGAPTAAVAVDEHGTVTYWNASAEALFGYSREAAVGRRLDELVLADGDRERLRAGMRDIPAGARSEVLDGRTELTAVRADGTLVPVELTVIEVEDEGQRRWYAFARDLSERHAAQADHDRLVGELRGALSGSERRFEAIVGSLQDPVTIRDRQDRLIYANAAAVADMGFASWPELRDTPPEQIMAEYNVFGADGRPISMDDIPSVRILRGEPAAPLLIRSVHRRTGAQRWQLLKPAPLLDDAGRVEATIMIIEDVTERQRAEHEAAFLAEASEVLASSLDYEETLRNVARLAVPGIVDWCAVDLMDEEGGRRQVALAHADPSRLALAEQLRAYEPERPDPERGIGRVFATGEPNLVPDVTPEMLERSAVDAAHLGLLRTIGLRSVMIVPVRLGDRTLGSMTLVNAESGRVLDAFDLRLAEQVAARAAVAIENARLYSERSQVAHTLQQSLLPEQLAEIPGYELASIYAPGLESTEVGGDFYDAWEVDGGWMIVIGDVTGKGVEAAAMTSVVRHTLRAASEFQTSPARLLEHADRALKRRSALSICTALCLRLDGEEVRLAAGGHPLPVLLSGGEVEVVGASGPLLGAFADADWEEHAFRMAPGSTLVTYTDGVTDAQGADGSRYGHARLCATIAGCPSPGAGAVVDCLSRALAAFRAGDHDDDTAVLAVHRREGTAAVGAGAIAGVAPPG